MIRAFPANAVSKELSYQLYTACGLLLSRKHEKSMGRGFGTRRDWGERRVFLFRPNPFSKGSELQAVQPPAQYPGVPFPLTRFGAKFHDVAECGTERERKPVPRSLRVLRAQFLGVLFLSRAGVYIHLLSLVTFYFLSRLGLFPWLRNRHDVLQLDFTGVNSDIHSMLNRRPIHTYRHTYINCISSRISRVAEEANISVNQAPKKCKITSTIR